MPADPRTAMTSRLVAWSAEGGAVVGMTAGNLDVVAPIRLPHQSEMAALEQHQHAHLSTNLAAHVVKVNDDVLSKVLDAQQGYASSIDNGLRRVVHLNGTALRVVAAIIAPGTHYDPATMDGPWVQATALANHADVACIPALPDDTGLPYLDRLAEARLAMARLPPPLQKPVVPSVSVANPQFFDVMNQLVAAEEPFILLEWHGRGRKQARLLDRLHGLMRAPAGAYRPFLAAFNVPIRFEGMAGSTPFLLARYGVQATAYAVVDPAVALHLAREARKGNVGPRVQFVRASGGWQDEDELDAMWAAGCICPAHDDALTDIMDFNGEIPYFARRKVHEFMAHLMDRTDFIQSVAMSQVPGFIAARDVLAASASTLNDAA